MIPPLASFEETHFDVLLIPAGHPRIRARDWLSPLVLRLLRNSADCGDGNAIVNLEYRNIHYELTQRQCTYSWLGFGEDVTLVRQTYQDSILTEFAALALACSFVERFAKTQVTEVTRRGEKVDYWLGNWDSVLEVSGLKQGNLHALHNIKAKQLAANPMRLSGYISVVDFQESRAHFYFYRYVEG